jgi:transcriptional regulator with XRE-family HTH domain
LAKKIGVSQQMLSRIEKGKENLSLLTLKNVTGSLGAQIYLEIK